jgi:hypothetical protein
MMTTAKTVTIAAALLLGGASLAMAQNGPPTGGQLPVAGGAGGGGWHGGWYPGYGHGYGTRRFGYYTAAPLYNYAPGYWGRAGYWWR